MRSLAAAVLLIALIPIPLFAQTEVDVAMRFFQEGGAYCVRLAPEGVALSEETEWTIMLMSGVPNRNSAFRLRTVDPGPIKLSSRALEAFGIAVTSVWRQDSSRQEFFDRFAAGISGQMLRVRVVKAGPPNLAQLKPEARADLYLKFADHGAKVSFDKAADLSVEEFQHYVTYLPD